MVLIINQKGDKQLLLYFLRLCIVIADDVWCKEIECPPFEP